MSRCMTSCPRLTSSKAEHCTICHETFTGSSSGDKHRIGQHGFDRRCRSVGEMLAAGMAKNSRGQWMVNAEKFWK